MKLYTIHVGGYQSLVRAARASVAVKRALDTFTESDVEGLPIWVGKVEKLQYVWCCVADVPCASTGTYERKKVSGEMSHDEALKTVEILRATRPELRCIRAVRTDKS